MEKNVSKFDKDFIKNYDEDSNKGYVLDVEIEYPKDILKLHTRKNKNYKNDIKLYAICIIKKNMLFI